jgi:hypothetical protein
MAENVHPGGFAGADARTQFAFRHPSTAWEQIGLGSSTAFFWTWFKPPATPHGFIIRIPDETFSGTTAVDDSARPPLTMRTLPQAVGIDPQIVACWYLCGSPRDGMRGTSPAFDEVIDQSAAGAEPGIVVLIEAPGAEIASAPVPSAAIPGGANLVKVFDEMEADWYASLLLEKQLMLARKQLTASIARLAALDRDLSPEERLHGDRRDRSDWQEIRRNLKDAATKLSRYVKEHDVGETSAAGKKVWFSETYHQYVVPRRPFDGLLALHREFEAHRKRLQILLQNMNLSNTNIAQEAERKAHQILSRIGGRARSAKNKTTGWTAHRWLNYKQRDSI